MGNSSRENKLNELSAQEWLKFTKTWFIHHPAPRKKNEILHPAKFPESLIEEFIRFFTKEEAVVFDPFLGTGSTLVACETTKRRGIGIELQEKYANIALERVQNSKKQTVILGNSVEIEALWKKYHLPLVDFVITSPPYGPMLNKRGLVTRKREKEGLDLNYSDDKNDLGNSGSYQEFVTKLVSVFVTLKPKLRKESYLVLILQNYMDKGEYKTLAWDVAKELSKYFQFRGERIWCQDNKTLYPYGYRYSFVPNVHHHYCLIFKNVYPLGL